MTTPEQIKAIDLKVLEELKRLFHDNKTFDDLFSYASEGKGEEEFHHRLMAKLFDDFIPRMSPDVVMFLAASNIKQSFMKVASMIAELNPAQFKE